MFVGSADQRFGPITMIRREGQRPVSIPWSAFTLSEADWQRVVDARDIVAVCFSLPFPLLLLTVDHTLGLEPSAAMFLFREPGDSMACATPH